MSYHACRCCQRCDCTLQVSTHCSRAQKTDDRIWPLSLATSPPCCCKAQRSRGKMTTRRSWLPALMADFGSMQDGGRTRPAPTTALGALFRSRPRSSGGHMSNGQQLAQSRAEGSQFAFEALAKISCLLLPISRRGRPQPAEEPLMNLLCEGFADGSTRFSRGRAAHAPHCWESI